MFNRDGLFGKKDDTVRKDSRSGVNLTPGLQTHSPPRSTPEPSKSAPQAPESAGPVPTRPEESKGSKLIVGPDITLKGAEITDCDTLVVEGRVEAAMDSRVIQIARHGTFAGTVGIDVAEIHGRFEGELTARKQLVIRSTGSVAGKIRYGKISIEEGGELSGDIDTISASSGAGASKSPRPGTASADIMTPYDPFAQKTKASPSPGKTTSGMA
jgi:cytoskeletal protein CcmA (bactofilin family)